MRHAAARKVAAREAAAHAVCRPGLAFGARWSGRRRTALAICRALASSARWGCTHRSGPEIGAGRHAAPFRAAMTVSALYLPRRAVAALAGEQIVCDRGAPACPLRQSRLPLGCSRPGYASTARSIQSPRVSSLHTPHWESDTARRGLLQRGVAPSPRCSVQQPPPHAAAAPSQLNREF